MLRLVASLLVLIPVALGGCGGGMHPWAPPASRDGHEDPASLRAGYGNAELHFWWPLTDAEVGALRGLDKAKAGDPQALLALAILASGDHRDSASYAGYGRRVDKFVADVRPSVEAAADDWHRGYELHRAMHRVFFPGERTALGSYDLMQSQVTEIFDRGRYNCISSAMLFAVVARQFSMPVRGVVVPTHAFIEVDFPGKVLEVETTTDTGFDLVHDARFFREQAATFSSSRGLRPVTIEDYEHRSIVAPYQLMGYGMRNVVGSTSPDEEEHNRLAEAWAYVDPDNIEAQRMRMGMYVNEANSLREKKAARTAVKMFDAIGPAVSSTAAKWASNVEITGLAAWAWWYDADALAVVGRGDDAVALANEVLDHFNPGWRESDNLRSALLSVLDDRMLELMTKKDFAAATQIVAKHLDACRTVDVCANNLRVVYQNWSIEYQRTGDWLGARQALSECVTQLQSDASCSDALRDLESRHRF